MWWRRRRDDDFREEVEAHIALEAERLRTDGVSAADAHDAARRAFGNVTRAQERFYESRRLMWLDDLVRDVRHAARTLSRAPGFTIVALVTLALGIGANTAIFTLVDHLLLRALPVSHPDRLAVIADPSRGSDLPPGTPNLVAFMWPNRMWVQIQQRPELFDGASAYAYSRVNLAAGGEIESVDGLFASGEFFDTLGVQAALGRTFMTADDRRGGGPAGPVAVISHGFWQRRFNSAPDIVGRSLNVERHAFTIVGVTSSGFTGPVPGRAFDVAVPIGTASLVRGPSYLDHAGINWLTIVARLKADQTLDSATTALRGVQPQIREASLPPGPPDRVAAYLRTPLTLLSGEHGNPLAPTRVSSTRPLVAMQLAVGLVLLIACANIANLMLTRAVSRRHEMSVRLALGASRWRLTRQLFVESVLLAVGGATSGFVLAQWGTRLLVRLFSTGSSPLTVSLAPDVRVLAFTLSLTILASILFGIVPAGRATRIDPADTLNDRRTVIGTRLRLAGVFVVGQIALSLVLVVGGGLLIRTYANLATMDLGFDPRGVLVLDIDARNARVAPARRLDMFDDVRGAVASVPGVAGAAIADLSTVGGGAMAGDVEVVGAPRPNRTETFFNRVSPGWLSLYRMALLSGRDFTDGDRPSSRPVAIVNRAFAVAFLGGADPVGHVIRQLMGPPGRPPTEWEVVGMTADAVYDSLRIPLGPVLYVAFDQIDEELRAVASPTSVALSLRSAGASPAALRSSVAAAIARVNPDLDLTFRPLADVVSGSISLEHTLAILSGFFGGLSLLLAIVGLYGVTSYGVGCRRREIGIRMALGATPGVVVRQVLSGVVALVVIGVAIGAVASIWASRLMSTLLFRLDPRDPSTLVASIALLTLAGVLAGWRPAWRASRVNPALALRQD